MRVGDEWIYGGDEKWAEEMGVCFLAPPSPGKGGKGKEERERERKEGAGWLLASDPSFLLPFPL